jgi:hypothetical protein
MKASVLFARFPFGGSEHPDTTDWLVRTVLEAKADRRVGDVFHTRVDDTPITMSRNRVLKQALDLGVDLVCMIDSDMRPDLLAGQPGARPFWASSLDFMLSHPGPCLVAAPYCGPPPHENVYVFEWSRAQSDHPDADLKLEQYTRERAQMLGGIQEAAALPTGLILIDTRALASVKPPWFEYEYEDPPFDTRKATTEDVYFTRNLSLAGVPNYCNWDAWAGHHKRKCVGKPSLLTVENVREEFREALRRGISAGERLVDVRRKGA